MYGVGCLRGLWVGSCRVLWGVCVALCGAAPSNPAAHIHVKYLWERGVPNIRRGRDIDFGYPAMEQYGERLLDFLKNKKTKDAVSNFLVLASYVRRYESAETSPDKRDILEEMNNSEELKRQMRFSGHWTEKKLYDEVLLVTLV